jgi:hypothetical protein
MVNDAAVAPEFSRPFPADQAGSREVTRDIEASPAERAALADRLDLIALDSLSASLRVRRLPDGLIRVSGRLDADVVQSCVVTLAPVASHCAAEFSMRFGAGAMPEVPHEIEIDSEGEDEPEPIADGQIDLGEAVVQQLAVSLDPYPRAPGAALPEDAAEGGAESGKESPFGSLARLRGGSGEVP